MKKFILLSLIPAIFTAHAQENMLSKRGTPILPEAGDWGIGFDASPFLRYAGNLFNQNGNTSPFAGYLTSGPAITGYYWKTPSFSYVGKLRLGFNSTSTDTLVNIAGINPNLLQTTNTTKVSTTNITLGFGVQKSRGKHRVRGNYGAEVLLMFGTGRDTTYTYGQGLLDTLPSPPELNPPRLLELNQGSSFGIGVRGFVGAEYFFAPKISIGIEYGWGLAFNYTGKGKTIREDIDNSGGVPDRKVVTATTGKAFAFGADIDNNGGIVALRFYF